jgi:hypothetical protein
MEIEIIQEFNECLICKESDIQLMKLECTHYYCKKCLKKWFENINYTHFKCCYCQKELKLKEKIYFLNYFYYMKVFFIYTIVFIYSTILLILMLLFFEKI